ncbi:MAG TPA: tRNA (adenosine(37)-N6)-threonylcarbamoyltransferase complex transferase subunit TsaD [Gaiellales bacterium]|nr:tRNA (adenosine(37)-N6)-threonylcarbamoyltransferase complex transferase subunit TsaD [Gaiellales bacterium]
MAGSAERPLGPVILAIETSCDDTCAAVVTRDGQVRAAIRSSQADLHARFGGVVPEIASRRHLELVVPVIETALGDAGATLDDVDAIAVTQGPGLIGALLVGLSTAKALAYGRGLPLVPVDHLLGHVAALRLEPLGLEPPFACLLASGGHTLVLDVADYAAPVRLGGTRDDAAGEAFDKGARLLGLGAAGGAALELLARDGDPERFEFPAVLRGQEGHDLSFSGLKTALLRRVRELGDDAGAARADLAAGYQAAIVRQLVERAVGALGATGRARLAVVGGVAANAVLRDALAQACELRGAHLSLLPPALCVDNAAMIAAAALAAPALEPSRYLALDAYARSPLAG